MDSRRDFIKKASLLGGGVGLWTALPASIQKAFAIDPPKGSTFYDAEHVVFLMQENRSFDHCFGTLQGVRGYNDPRAIDLPNRNKVWLQTDEQGHTYAPFRLDIKNTKSTWTGNLPHSWTNQTDARNNGGFDRWLEAKRSGDDRYAHMPLTLGHYTREDIPFYFSLADAFTVCDQHFCSSLTGTTPNRLFFFTGKLRGGKDNQANVDNSNVDYGKEASWETFPQRLEEAGISWKVYQNEISLDTGLEGEAEFWLSNFTDNPLEWFTQHRIGFSKSHYKHCQQELKTLPAEIKELEGKLSSMTGKEKDDTEKKLLRYRRRLSSAQTTIKEFNPEAFDRLTIKERNLHDKAFTINDGDPDFHKVEAIRYKDGAQEKEMMAPKGDVFYQFRKDVDSGKLPTVSWLVAPQAFSDHPSSPWYGAWYVSEAMDILTKNPEVWKKTIFVLTYDENDGYYDHIPPFVAPNPQDEKTGKVSSGLDAAAEYVTLEQDLKRVGEENADHARESPVGLGYRVPMVVASPWSRGGWVNSQVFDHTSVLQFLETLLEKKSGKKIREENISSWRRAVCGNLHSVFRPFNGEKLQLPFIDRNPFLGSIHQAKDKQLPDGFHLLNPAEIAAINDRPAASPYMPKQEPGVRDACALPYELLANARLKDLDNKELGIEVILKASMEHFGSETAGAPFTVYALGEMKDFDVRNFSIKPGDALTAFWSHSLWAGKNYLLRLYGPNGYFRQWSGQKGHANIVVALTYEEDSRKKLTGHVQLKFINKTSQPQQIRVKDNSYGASETLLNLEPNDSKQIIYTLKNSHGWYDLSVSPKQGDFFEVRFAGRVEDGKPGKTDPAMGDQA